MHHADRNAHMEWAATPRQAPRTERRRTQQQPSQLAVIAWSAGSTLAAGMALVAAVLTLAP